MQKKWDIVIGLEVHVQLATSSKLFSGASTAFGKEPNSQACLIDLAYPGTLPVPNAAAIEMAIKFGLSIQANIAHRSIFARKNYFYPDLPKGYQISQFDKPIIENGHLNIEIEDDDQTSTAQKHITIARAHLEEDAGKLLHEHFHNQSGIDFNRAGIPLLEIVSAPDLRSSKEAVAYLKTLHKLVRYLNISDANMQEGSFRCDANVSVKPKSQQNLGTRTEIKNLNSFRFIERAIDYEATRQISVLEQGGTITQETRLYDSEKNETRPLRSKEEALDYRYFPDPDLLPVSITDAEINKIRQTMPELPWEKCSRFQEEYGLNKSDAALLSASRPMAEYFETTAKTTSAPAKLAANWVLVELQGALNKMNIDISQSPISPAALAELLDKIQDQTISGKTAKEIFFAMLEGEGTASAIIAKKNLTKITDSGEITKIIDKIMSDNQTNVQAYKSGKTQVFGYFVGQVMQATRGKADPKIVNQLLKQRLDEN